MRFLKSFFCEADGSSSMMRLCTFLATTGIIGLAFYIQSSESGWNAYNAAMISSSFGLIFGMKAWQRKHESKEYIEELKAATQA